MKDDERKEFSYIELKAICLLCAAHGAFWASEVQMGKYSNEKSARKILENDIEKVIDTVWNEKP